MTRLFAFTLFLSSTLIFIVQPLVAKILLPVFGGGPAVWSTCLVFFQAVLLCGYVYAHALTRSLSVIGQRRLHVCLLAAASCALPMATTGIDAGSANSPWWVLWTLVRLIGLPCFALSATAPLLLHWFANSARRRAPDPYFLYSISNAGSLLGLLGYLLVEPVAARASQGFAWSCGFWIVAVLVATCAYVAAPTAVAIARGRARRPAIITPVPLSRQSMWVVLALVPSALLVGVTQHLATDVVSVPLLWLVPLTVYLVTFIVAFSARGGGSSWMWGRLAPIAALLVLGCSLAEIRYPVLPIAVMHAAAFAVLAMLCHTRLAEARPDAAQLTRYFACVALGGVVGGIAAALIAPVIFSSVLEYPIAIAAALLLRPQTARADRASGSSASRWAWRAGAALLLVAACWLVLSGNHESAAAPLRPWLLLPACLLLIDRRTALLFAGATAGLLIAAGVTRTGGEVLARERTFFGTHQVTAVQDGAWHVLTHGTTTHGLQAARGKGRALPAAYYHPSGPLGDIVFTLGADGRFRNVAVVGLGTGAIAGYADNGTHVDFFEVDEAVIRIAENPAYFTYLADARSRRDVTVRATTVDGRLGLAAAAPGSYDLIVIDAFSSDAIPTHLLTREAVAMYVSRLSPRGLLAFHVSNRFFDLPPVLARAAAALNLQAYVRRDMDVPPEREGEGMRPSVWVVMARDAADAGQLPAAAPRWITMAGDAAHAVWTDDFSNVFAALAR